MSSIRSTTLLAHHRLSTRGAKAPAARALAVMAAASTLQVLAVAPAAAARLEGVFGGGSRAIYATAVTTDIAVQFRNSAAEKCPCSGTNGVTRKSATVSLTVGPSGSILTGGALSASSYGLRTASTAATMQTANITKLNLLGGLITADALKAVAKVDATASTLTASDAGSRIAHLVIAGHPVAANVPDNTVIPLTGLGSVTVKAVTGTTGKDRANTKIDMLLVTIDQTNSLGLPVGATIVIGQAAAAFNRNEPAVAVSGGANGITVKGDVGSVLQESAGDGSQAGIGNCIGTNGNTITHSVTNINVPGLLSLGTVTSTAFGGPLNGAIVAKTSAQAANISLLGGLIAGTAITAVAQESYANGVITPSVAGSGFTNLTIAGTPIPDNTPPNTQIALPGIGYVVLDEQIENPDGTVSVTGLDIVVTAGNSLGLPVGASLAIAHAVAGEKKLTP